MKQPEADVESSAQLLSKETPSSSEEFEYDDSEDSQSWSTPRRSDHSPTQNRLWRRLRSLPVPNWLPTQRVNPRYFVLAIVVSLAVTLFIFNPYAPSKSTQHQSDADADADADAPYTSTKPPQPTSTSNHHVPEPAATYHPPKPEPNDRFCTTWPVDENGEYDLRADDRMNNFTVDSIAPKGGWKKPTGLKIVAMIFYGRKRYVDVLDCYLQQNLASNGGYLDEVWFMAHTKKKDDVEWVEDLVAGTPSYKLVGKGVCEGKKYKCMWNYAVEDKTIYVKIDDDILYIHPDAIPQLVHTRLALPHPYAISANLVNSPVTGMEQYHFGAIHPFLPDPSSKPTFRAAETWRVSEKKKYPQLDMLEDYDMVHMKTPYRGHPWLLISDDHYELLKTPMGKYDQDRGGDAIAFGPAWKSWGIGAQQQYSLLYNLEMNKVQRYFFGRHIGYPPGAKAPNASAIVAGDENGPGGEQTYDTGYNRYNLNFVAVWGSDIRDELPIADDDEQDITADIPRRIGRPFLIDTRAVVSHFSFFTQQDGITTTDLLDRYRALANEAVCKPYNFKKPWDLLCDGFKVEGDAER